MEARLEDRRVFELLRREDKHYLGGGDGLIFAPPLPLWLDRPGFWDGVHYFLFAIRPAFTVTLVNPMGRERPLDLRSRVWTPAELNVRYASGGLDLRERRIVLPGGRLISEWVVTNRGDSSTEHTLVAWTAQEGADLRDRAAIAHDERSVRWRMTARDAQLRGDELELDAKLVIADGDGSCIAESQHMRSYPNPPHWAGTPFSDHWVDRRLVGVRRIAPAPPERGRTLVFAGVSRPLRLEPGESTTLQVRMELDPVRTELRLPRPPLPVPGNAWRASYESWSRFYQGTPLLAASDPWVERYFAYRWYGLRLNFLGPAGNYAAPTCAQGTEFSHGAVSYSAWCHTRELRWLADPTRARGTLRTFLRRQRADGGMPGIVFLDGVHPNAFYIADWGGSLLALEEVHPDADFLAECYGPLDRFAEHMRRERDADGEGMYDVCDPHETGQETMSRYLAVDPDADRQHFEYRLRLKGIDATIYMYRLHRALARVAATLRQGEDVRRHDAIADRIAEAVLAQMWDPGRQLFSDVDPRTGRRTLVKAAVCFYPFLTDIPAREHVAGLNRHLFDQTAFWLPYPVPSTAADDPTFSADAEWKQVRQNCTWNGRVWPMANSHLVDALGTVSTTLDPGLRARTAELLTSYLRMLFFDGDPLRPNSFEHYSPFTGRPSIYRGLDDYQHSWVNDLLVRYIAGLRPTPRGFVLDPFPCDLEFLRLERLPFRGRAVTVEIEEGAVRVVIDGGDVREARIGEPLTVELA